MKNLITITLLFIAQLSFGQDEIFKFDSTTYQFQYKIEYDTLRAMGLQFVSYGNTKEDFGYNIDKLLIINKKSAFSVFDTFYKVVRFRQEKPAELNKFTILSDKWIWEETSLDEYDQIITERKKRE